MQPERLLKEAPRLADRLGLVEMLGWGQQGAVYLLRNGNVMKIQAEPHEAHVAAHLERLRQREWTKSSGLPHIFSVRHFRLEDGQVLYAYERENLADVPDWLRWYGPFLERTVLLCAKLTAQVRAAKGLLVLPPDHDARKLSPYSRDPDFVNALRQVERTLKLVAAAGIAPKDAHPANWGVRKSGELVIRDFGLFTIP